MPDSCILTPEHRFDAFLPSLREPKRQHAMADDLDGKKLRFKVFVRLRPLTDSASSPNGVCKTEHRIVTVHDPTKDHSSEFVFDRVFPSSSTQDEVFEEVGKPLVEHAMQGYNACCFAYGQTSSGKTFTMFGKETGEPGLRGIIPRAIEEVFKVGAEVAAGSSTRYAFFVSFLEIYLEQVRDLGKAALMSKESGGRVNRRDMEEWAKSNLDVMEDAQGQTSVKDLQYIEVSTAAEVMSLLDHGSALRTTASTALNDVSSRSHTVFTISIVQFREGNKPITGRLHLVDLAGSERQSKTNSEGQRLTEAKSINKSLTALGKVVMALSQEGEKGHVPFRDSKLTRILKDSLQGNSLTSMVAALNPLPDNADECFNTLQFAVRCQTIDLAPHINVVGASGMGGGAGALGAGVDVESLLAQIAALQEELDYTHAHYQKILESVAGPGWTQNPGPLERGPGSEGFPLGAGAGRAQNTALSAADTASTAGDLSARPGSTLSRPQTATGDVKTRRLEMQLESSRSAQKEAEDQLVRRKMEYDELRDRTVAKERSQFTEIKKLRAQVQDLQSKMTDMTAEAQHKSDEAQKRHEQEVSRLNRDGDLLRSQLAQLQSSINGIMEARAHKAIMDGKARDQAKLEADRQAAQKVATISAEKERQVENLRQQSTYYVKTKSDEINRLAAELSAVQRRSADETAALQAECEYLAAYAERVTEVLRNMQQGVYRTVDRGTGLKSFKLPARDRPPALDSERLTYLQKAGQQAERLLSLSATLASDAMASSLASTASKAAGASEQESQPEPASQSITLMPRQHLDLGPELSEARERWEASEPVTQVPAETLSYISSLEAALTRYRADVQLEKRRHQEMLVSLRSHERFAAGRAPSPLNSVMQNPVLMEPKKWGYGHTSAPYLHSSARPMTASGRLNGNTAMQSPSGSPRQYRAPAWNSRPLTATAMQTLTAPFLQNGIIIQ